MKVYIQTDKNNIPLTENVFVAMNGFKKMGFEIVLFDNLDEVASTMNREDIVVGGIATVRRRLKALNIASDEINYPKEIRKYLGRKIWFSDMDTVASKPNLWPVFVKSVEGKKIVGRVIRTVTDLNGLGSSFENPPVICSEVVDFVSEWRVFVRYGRVEGVKQYLGNWYYPYDHKVIDNCLHDYKSIPAGCSVDFGVTKEGKTLLIEVNDGYSLASYGLMDIRYAKLLSARWAELTGTEDECAFDL